MAALVPDERRVALAILIYFMPFQTKLAISGTSAATYEVMEPH